MTERLHFHFSRLCIGQGNGNPLQCSCLENHRDRGAWWAAVYGVTQTWTRLKWLSSSSSILYICVLSRFSHVWLFATLWTIACQVPLSMGFSRKEYWSGLSCPLQGSYWPRDRNNVSYISCNGRWVLYHLRHLGSLYCAVLSCSVVSNSLQPSGL